MSSEVLKPGGQDQKRPAPLAGRAALSLVDPALLPRARQLHWWLRPQTRAQGRAVCRLALGGVGARSWYGETHDVLVNFLTSGHHDPEDSPRMIGSVDGCQCPAGRRIQGQDHRPFGVDDVKSAAVRTERQTVKSPIG